MNKLKEKLKKMKEEEKVEEEEEEEEEEKPTPKKPSKEDLIKAEVDLLNNNGIFRRELLSVLHNIADALTEDEEK